MVLSYKKWHLRSGNEKSEYPCKLNEKTVYSQKFEKRNDARVPHFRDRRSLVYQNEATYFIRLHQSELEAEWYEFGDSEVGNSLMMKGVMGCGMTSQFPKLEKPL